MPSSQLSLADLPARPATRGTIVVVDEETQTRESLMRLLENAGFGARAVSDRDAGARAVYQGDVNAVLIGLDVPGLDAMRTVERIRAATNVPIVAMSTSDAEVAKVFALSYGADVYLTRPVGELELIARLDSLLRFPPSSLDTPSESYSDSRITVDFVSGSVWVDGEQPVDLSRVELAVLRAFVTRPRETLSCTELLDQVWKQPLASVRRVKVYVGCLRAKFASAGYELPIVTRAGFGYRFVPPPAKPFAAASALEESTTAPTRQVEPSGRAVTRVDPEHVETVLQVEDAA